MRTFSIIIPTYNAAATLAFALKSIACQKCDDYEIIIIDGGSDDNTSEIISQFSSLITYASSEKDSGIYDAMNKGICRARGKYVLFLGADDSLYNDEVLSTALPMLKDDVIYYGQAYFTHRRKVYDGKFNKYKLALRNICHQAIFYPLSIMKHHSFDIKYPLLSDYYYNLHLYQKGIPFVYISIIIANFNDSASSASAKDVQFERNKLKIIRETLGIGPFLYSMSRRLVRLSIT